ncbi:hypothetical protein ACEPAH_6795 [Sanghuangporus vaninii]
MVRLFTGRQNVIRVPDAYHGRAFGAMALTRSKTIYFDGSEPLMPDVFPTPFPYWHQLNLPPTTSEEELVSRCIYQLELLLVPQTSPYLTAAIIIEPVIGEVGYVPAPASYLKALREIADKHGIMLIFDEKQPGFGSISQSSIVAFEPICCGVVTTRQELIDKLKPGSMGEMYASNANVLENAQIRSKELLTSLEMSRIVRTHRRIWRAMYRRSALRRGSIYQVIQFIPPLNNSGEDRAKGCEIFAAAVEEVVREG